MSLQPAPGEQFVDLGHLSMRSQRDGDTHVVRLAGELDLASAGDVERELLGAEQSDAATVVVDLSELTFMDSSGIRVLLAAGARSQEDGKRLLMRRPPAAVRRVLALAGVEDLLPFAD